jgi:hypothetical protein
MIAKAGCTKEKYLKKKIATPQVLARIRGKRNPLTLLVGM